MILSATLGFQSCQWRTQAEVDPMPEGEVQVQLAVDVEAVRIGEWPSIWWPRRGKKGIELVGPNGLLSQLTKWVLETALEAEMTDHLGYDKHDPVGRNRGNSRNGVRSKTALTEIGPVEIEVPVMSRPRSHRRLCRSGCFCRDGAVVERPQGSLGRV